MFPCRSRRGLQQETFWVWLQRWGSHIPSKWVPFGIRPTWGSRCLKPVPIPVPMAQQQPNTFEIQLILWNFMIRCKPQTPHDLRVKPNSGWPGHLEPNCRNSWADQPQFWCIWKYLKDSAPLVCSPWCLPTTRQTGLWPSELNSGVISHEVAWRQLLHAKRRKKALRPGRGSTPPKCRVHAQAASPVKTSQWNMIAILYIYMSVFVLLVYIIYIYNIVYI